MVLVDLVTHAAEILGSGAGALVLRHGLDLHRASRDQRAAAVTNASNVRTAEVAGAEHALAQVLTLYQSERAECTVKLEALERRLDETEQRAVVAEQRASELLRSLQTLTARVAGAMQRAIAAEDRCVALDAELTKLKRELA